MRNSLPPWLTAEQGIEARHVQELGLLLSRDAGIFSAAGAATEPVAILTKDDDFSRLVIQHGPPPQVVWLRCGNVSNLELRRIRRDAWPRAARLLAGGEALVEIRRRRDR
jgi:predicted nuclease of predicted toxin-antitoxin system